MAFDLNRFKRINIKYKHTVYGYLREIQSLFSSDIPYYNIHELIKQTCTLFYASIHEWDKNCINPHRIKLDKENNAIQQITKGSSSSYLQGTFDSGIHNWKFRINKLNQVSYWTCTLGIYKMKDGDPQTNVPFSSKNQSRLCGYGYAYDVGRKTDLSTGAPSSKISNTYGVKVTAGDVVEMHCDMNKLELSFSVNGQHQGIAFDNLEQTEYKVAVNLYMDGDMVTLLD